MTIQVTVILKKTVGDSDILTTVCCSKPSSVSKWTVAKACIPGGDKEGERGGRGCTKHIAQGNNR